MTPAALVRVAGRTEYKGEANVSNRRTNLSKAGLLANVRPSKSMRAVWRREMYQSHEAYAIARLCVHVRVARVGARIPPTEATAERRKG